MHVEGYRCGLSVTLKAASTQANLRRAFHTTVCAQMEVAPGDLLDQPNALRSHHGSWVRAVL